MDDASTLTSVPDDPQALKRLIVDLSRERDDWHAKFQNIEIEKRRIEVEKQTIEVEKLRLEVELLRLKKWYYGSRADRLQTPGEVAQMLLEFNQELEARPVNPEDLPPDESRLPPRTVRRVHRGRRNLAAFENLPTIRQEHDLPEDQKPCPCCGEMRQRIGQETSWQIEYIPGRFERIEHVQFKYACRQCEQNAENPNIELAEKPSQPIDKGMAGPGLLAYIVTSKYADYLPLYRLESIFERNGLEVSRATQGVWCRDVAQIIRPLFDLMVSRVLQSHVICTDDTVMPMLWPGKTKQARMWVYVGDEHNPYNVFDFTPGRGRDGPVRFLKDYQQTLLADAYGGYDGVVVGNQITRAGCWAHARRKFVDAEKTHPAIAAEAVGIIKRLYAVEEQAASMDSGQARAKSNEDRLCLRQSQSQPILTMLRERLWTWKDQLLPKHPMAEAVNYTLNQWQELSVFATDGSVPMDNNVSEREMKRIVLNRKNSLFVGNERGGETAAILSSLTSTCRRHGIDPQRYLTQLLTNLPATPISQISQWLPDHWKQRNPQPSG
jgi:transposase